MEKFLAFAPITISCATLGFVIWQTRFAKKTRTEDKEETFEANLTKLINDVDAKVNDLGREVSHIQGRLGVTTRVEWKGA